MATLTVNVSVNGSWYGSVTTDEADTPEVCEQACALLERLLAGRARAPRLQKPDESVETDAPSDELRATILDRLTGGVTSKPQLVAGLPRHRAGEALRSLLAAGEAHVASDDSYRPGPSPRRAK